MLTSKFKRLFISPKSVGYDRPYHRFSCQTIINSFGLQRSGQHLIIDWVCRGLVDAIHLNHCRFFEKGSRVVLTPKTGRRVIYSLDRIDDSKIQGRKNFAKSLPDTPPKNLFFSLEDVSFKDANVMRLISSYQPRILLILRDPANWLASSLKHQRCSPEELLQKIVLLKEYLGYANSSSIQRNTSWLVVNYNQFIMDKEYRFSLSRALDLADFERAELALEQIPPFGGGSSFSDDAGSGSDPLNRWTQFKDDDFFRSVLNDPELISQGRKFFGDCPGLDDIAYFV